MYDEFQIFYFESTMKLVFHAQETDERRHSKCHIFADIHLVAYSTLCRWLSQSMAFSVSETSLYGFNVTLVVTLVVDMSVYKSSVDQSSPDLKVHPSQQQNSIVCEDLPDTENTPISHFWGLACIWKNQEDSLSEMFPLLQPHFQRIVVAVAAAPQLHFAH